MVIQLPVFGCARCGAPPGSVSKRLCDDCLRMYLVDSTNGVEHWLEHPELAGWMVSNLGRVRNPSGKALKGFPGGKGNYPTVQIGTRRRRIHHLVLETYIGPRPPGMLALHWDDVAEHCHLMNLRWDTPPANYLDGVRNRRRAYVGPTCTVHDCDEPLHSNGMCAGHFRDYRRQVVRRVLRSA